METHQVRGGDGLRLHVREWGGAESPPILFIHGWSQNHMCWQRQVDSALADEFRLVALDLRGHGMSDTPLEAEHYTNARLWADDIAAVIEQLGLKKPVLVGWSYGGIIMCDYMRAYGQDRIAGVNFLDAAVTLDAAALGKLLVGPGFLEPFQGATADDLPTNIEAMRRFVRACLAKPLPADLHEQALCWNIVVPAKVRLALVQREVRSDDVLSTLAVPVLVTHGELDTVVLPAMAEHVLATCPKAEASWFAGVAHAPHLEDPARYNRELAEFARRAHGQAKPS
jgi:pimeloyl-ACP methyl ester carboxylesterase